MVTQSHVYTSLRPFCRRDPSLVGAPPTFKLQLPSTKGPYTAPHPAPQCGRQRSALLQVTASSTLEEAPSQAALTSISTAPGTSQPLGPSAAGPSAVNFALHAPAATAVTLCLFDESGSLFQEVEVTHRTGSVWSVKVEGLAHKGVLYGYRVAGQGGWETPYRWDSSKVLIDPYAPLIKGRNRYGQRDEFEQFELKKGSRFLGTYDFEAAPFDWGSDYKAPGLQQKDLVVYECPIRTFTASPTSGLPEEWRGTFAGMKAKIPHLKELGINAVELLPVFDWDELEFQRIHNPREHMINIWGYSHMSFIAIAPRLASAGGSNPAAAAREFKELVREFHNNGIEVILDVVYNHTAEGGDDDPYLLSWRGIDCCGYYMLDPTQYVQLLNYSGCGNTTNANHECMKNLILDSLKWWVTEYHIDGFRFDLATALCRDAKGTVLTRPPLIEAIAKDPVLSNTKLLAEPWDCGAYQVGEFPNWDRWSEWNGKFRDDIRSFIKGDAGKKPSFATRMAGSADLYNKNKRRPCDSINFVIAHDGFTLYDLVAYNEKHNDANGEGNRDGSNDNFSWNCGIEGETGDQGVMALRYRQMKNLHMALMLSHGTPMVLAGDEYAQTRYGNNNWYGHDTELTWFDWDKMEQQKDKFFSFYSGMIKFRLACPLLRRERFLTPEDLTWHEDNWDNPESKFIAFTIHDRGEGFGSLYAAFNAHTYAVPAHLPPAPAGRSWVRVVDTNLEWGRDFTPDSSKPLSGDYLVQPFSSILLHAKQL